MATVVIQKRKGKKGMSYAVRYADPLTGRKKHFKTLKKYKEAQQTANDLRTLLDFGKNPEKTLRKLNLLNFNEVADSLQNEWISRLNRNELSDKSYKEYCIWLNVLRREFGKELLCKITVEEIIAFRDGQIAKNSVISANRYLTIIKFVFAHGLHKNAILELSLIHI